MKKICLWVFTLLAVLNASAQTVFDNNPGSVEWYQVNTPHFRVLYPGGFDEQAQGVANTLEQIYEPETRTLLGAKPRRLPVILQNRSSASNAFVSITPRRSEFYTMPSQNYNFIGNNDWLTMLASHEYRHVVQYQHANQGMNRFFFHLFGYNTLSLLANLAAPQWFWEGDAVSTETAFTHTGRGRIPEFAMVFRTNLLEGRTFNYHKQYLRSYKDNIPNHYVLGYHMVSYLRQRTGDPEVWGKITERAWRRSLFPFTFSNAIKKETGLHVTDLYKEMAKDLKKEWHARIDTLTLTAFTRMNSRPRHRYTDYEYPQALGDGKVLAMKSGIGDIEKFVVLDGNGEEKAGVPGIMNYTGMLSAAAGRVVWNEYRYDPRWRMRTYSVVKAMDIASGKIWTVGPAQVRYAGAALSHDGQQVVTVESSNTYQHRLVVMDVVSGQIKHTYPNPDNHFFSMPRWSPDGQYIVALMTTDAGKSVVSISVQTGALTTLVPAGNENIGYPVLHGDYLFYNSPLSGVDNIYARNLKTNQVYRVTNSRYGAFNPAISADGEDLFYNDQGPNGLDVVMAPLNASAWQPLTEAIIPADGLDHLDETVQAQEGEETHTVLANVPHNEYPVTRYHKARGLINPYAWGAYTDNSLEYADLGVTSRDILSTISIDAGYRYDIAEGTRSWHAGISYQGWYPIVDFDVSYGNREYDEGDITLIRYNTATNRQYTTVEDLTFKWQETNAELTFRLPFLLTRSKYNAGITLSNAVGVTHVTDFRNNLGVEGRRIPYDSAVLANGVRYYFFEDYVGNGNLVYNHFSLSAYHYLKTSRRDINPQWGQQLYMHVYNTPYGGDYSGVQFSTYAVLYLPGLFKHHSLWGYAGYQYTGQPKSTSNGEEPDIYVFRNQIPVPRGVSISRYENMVTFSGNYTLPLWYPDIALGPVLNLQRVRGNVFLDYGYGSTNSSSGLSTREYVSTGAEIKVDFNVFRLLPQMDLGFRYSYGLQPSGTKYEVLIGTINL